MKTCRICQTEKPESAFKMRTGPKKVLRNECRACENMQRNPRTRQEPVQDKPFMGWGRK